MNKKKGGRAEHWSSVRKHEAQTNTKEYTEVKELQHLKIGKLSVCDHDI